MIRIYIVDDQAIVRDGLQYILNHQPDMQTVGVAGSVHEALQHGPSVRMDVALIDIRLPDGSGLDIVRASHQWSPAPKALLLTTFDVEDYVLEALRVGARGYVLKDLPTEELLATIRAVNRGEALYRTTAAGWALAHVFAPPTTAGDESTLLQPLTDREAEVLRRMANGERNSDIAAALFVSEGTVKTHVHNILQKLGVQDRTEAVVWAFRHGFVR
jgi:DNA-binding NarL/FixJ family response regulator